MNAARLYSPAIVLLLWALIAAAGITGAAVTSVGLALLAVAVAAHTVEITGHV